MFLQFWLISASHSYKLGSYKKNGIRGNAKHKKKGRKKQATHGLSHASCSYCLFWLSKKSCDGDTGRQTDALLEMNAKKTRKKKQKPLNRGNS